MHRNVTSVKIRPDRSHFIFKHVGVVKKAIHGHVQVNTLTLILTLSGK